MAGSSTAQPVNVTLFLGRDSLVRPPETLLAWCQMGERVVERLCWAGPPPPPLLTVAFVEMSELKKSINTARVKFALNASQPLKLSTHTHTRRHTVSLHSSLFITADGGLLTCIKNQFPWQPRKFMQLVSSYMSEVSSCIIWSQSGSVHFFASHEQIPEYLEPFPLFMCVHVRWLHSQHLSIHCQCRVSNIRGNQILLLLSAGAGLGLSGAARSARIKMTQRSLLGIHKETETRVQGHSRGSSWLLLNARKQSYWTDVKFHFSCQATYRVAQPCLDANRVHKTAKAHRLTFTLFV